MNRTLECPTSEPQEPQSDRHGMQAMTEVLTGPEVREQLGISRATWLRWRKSGAVPAPVTLPGAPRWRRSDIERFKEGGRRYFTTHRTVQKQSVTRRVVRHAPECAEEQR